MDLFQWRVVCWGVKVASESHSNEMETNLIMFWPTKYIFAGMIQIVHFDGII